MPSKYAEPRRRRSPIRRSSSSYAYGGGDDRDDYSSRRRSSDWELDYRTSRDRDPVQRDIYKVRSVGSSSVSRPAPARRTYSRDSESTPRTVSDSSSSRRRKVYNVVDLGMERRASASKVSGSRVSSTPYPSFSKAHSREAVGQVEDGVNPRPTPRARDSTNLTQQNTDSDKPFSPNARNYRSSWTSPAAPPSPPLTAQGSDVRRVYSGSNIRQDADAALRFSASRVSLRDAEEGRSSPKPSRRPSAAAPSPLRNAGPATGLPNGERSPLSSSTPTRGSPTRKPASSQRSAVSHPTDSDATPIINGKRQNGRPPTLPSPRDVSPPSDADSLPRTPDGHGPRYSASGANRKDAPAVGLYPTAVQTSQTGQRGGRPFSTNGAGSVPLPPPPPPPPPLEVSSSGAPTVDYLLQNGGLAKQITKRFVSASNSQPPLHSYQQYMSPPPQRLSDAYAPFAPYQALLDDMEKVMARNGSIAVATGYNSVARRLLDRLETVFARNISSQVCACVMCAMTRQESQPPVIDVGVDWGEVLELVSGRRELPPWPPFSISTSAAGLGLSTMFQKPPMQKLDIDVPEEYRDHYIRQSKKTKQAVDKWLATQPEDHPSPPTEIDDETLTFTMLTYLEPAQRRLFTALIRGLSTIPDSRVPTPAAANSKSDLMTKVGVALERLYRLPRRPREPESSMYLLNNPSIHNVLATLAALSDHEWDVIVSGRFDGFLVSGPDHQSQSVGAVGSRGTTPASRGPTSSRNGGPPSAFQPPASNTRNGSMSAPPTNGKTGSVSNTGVNTPAPGQFTPGPSQQDEETEIAVLAEVEREIYLGMEALEDAFEALHLKAESMRRKLRERGAGLSLQARAMGRRGSEKELDARLGTPFDGVNFAGTPGPSWNFASAAAQSHGPGGGSASAMGLPRPGESDDDGLDDAASLAPDDSASNAGWKERKHRHHRHRRPRRTPAPVDEGSE